MKNKGAYALGSDSFPQSGWNLINAMSVRATYRTMHSIHIGGSVYSNLPKLELLEIVWVLLPGCGPSAKSENNDSHMNTNRSGKKHMEVSYVKKI